MQKKQTKKLRKLRQHCKRNETGEEKGEGGARLQSAWRNEQMKRMKVDTRA